MSISKREKILIVIFFLIASICLYYFFFLKPHMEEMSTLNENISEYETQVITNKQLYHNKNALAEQMDTQQTQLDELSKGITRGFDQPPLLVYLDDTVKEYGTKITYLFSEVRQSGELYVCPVTVTLTADYNGIKDILKTLAEGEYFVKVTGLLITAFDQPVVEVLDEDDETVVPEQGRELSVTLHLEFYSLIGDIPPDTTYTFSDGYRFGTDVFG